MDSPNSGSMQSSSGGDEEFDSRNDSFSAFLNPSNSSSTNRIGVMSTIQQPPSPSLPQLVHPHHHPHPHPHPHPHTHTHTLPHPHHHQHHPTNLFDPLSNYFDVFTPSTAAPNSMLNLDMVWPRGGEGGAGGAASESNCTTQPGGLPSLTTSQHPPPGRTPPTPTHTQFPGSASKPFSENNSRPSSSPDQNNAVRNPKKRTRASRRAPTTVLTTDTSNFRAMVQEFTGIPAPPFSNSPFPRTRFDLFSNASSTMRSSFDPSPQPPHPPPYLLRPFAQKIQPPPFLSSTTTTTATNTSQNLLSMQNSLPTTFHSLLQSPNASIFSSKAQTLESISENSSSKLGVLEDFGMSHGHLGTLSNLVTTGGLSLRRSNDNWGDGMGSSDQQNHLRTVNVNNYGVSSQKIGNSNSCKMNFSSSSSDFHTEKTPQEIVTTRGEGMLDSWICSSD